MFKFLHAADIHLDSPQKGLDRYEGAPVMAAKKIELTAKPLSQKIDVPTEPSLVYVLHIEGIEVPPTKSAVVRVFANLPTATPETSIEDPHYIGYFTILAKTSKVREQHKSHTPTNVMLDVPADLGKMLRGKPEVEVTLVPVAGVSSRPQDVKLSFQRIRLTVTK